MPLLEKGEFLVSAGTFPFSMCASQQCPEACQLFLIILSAGSSKQPKLST